MKIIDPASAFRRRATSASRLLLVIACLVSVTLAAVAQEMSSKDELGGVVAEELVWITMGADAFESLQEREDVIAGTRPLGTFGEAPGVVLTRVRLADLDAISGLLHEEYRRCPGFVYHETLADARHALVAVTAPPAREPQAYTIDQPLAVFRLTAAIQKPEILETIERLSTDFNNRYHAHPSGTAAAQWIRDQWQGYAAGRPDVTVELVDHDSTSQPSVILTIAGTTFPDEVVVLGGHLDSTSFDGGGPGNPDFIAPGADDDASGIAVLSEVVRVAMAQGFHPQRTVSFMAYAAEEVGLRGSDEIAAQYLADGVDVIAVLQLDMTDYFGSDEDIGLLSDHTDSTLTAFVGQLLDAYQPDLVWALTACGFGCSDHASWDDRGFPAAMSFESLFGEHNPEIHSIDDTLATLGNNVDHAAKFVRLGVAFMVEIAKEGSIDIFADGFESGDTTSWSLTIP